MSMRVTDMDFSYCSCLSSNVLIQSAPARHPRALGVHTCPGPGRTRLTSRHMTAQAAWCPHDMLSRRHLTEPPPNFRWRRLGRQMIYVCPPQKWGRMKSALFIVCVLKSFAAFPSAQVKCSHPMGNRTDAQSLFLGESGSPFLSSHSFEDKDGPGGKVNWIPSHPNMNEQKQS